MAGSILRRISTGDRAAVEEAIDAYGGLIWSLARRLCPNRADAEDAVQEIFIDLWKSAGRFDETLSSETTFIAMVARRRLIDRLRRAGRMPHTEELSADLVDHSRLDRQVEINAEAALAAQAMSQLRPEQQQVLKLSIYQGLSHQEIARATGLPLGTVKTHARRGLLHIREALGIRSLRVEREAR